MNVIAPHPYAEFPVGPTLYVADHLQIVRDVEPDHLMALVVGGCVVPKPVVAAHYFPAGSLSVHCFECGASMECPPELGHFYWLRKGDVQDFYFQHEYYCCGLRGSRVAAPEPELSERFAATGQAQPSASLMAPGVPLSEMTHIVLSGGEDPTLSQNLALEETPDPAMVLSMPPADLRPLWTESIL